MGDFPKAGSLARLPELAMDELDAAIFGTPANDIDPKRTGNKTALGLLTFDQVIGRNPVKKRGAASGALFHDIFIACSTTSLSLG